MNWAELPRDILFLIFITLGSVEILFVQGVCRSWWQLSLDPQLWSCIDLRCKPTRTFKNHKYMEQLVRVAVDRSGGHLQEFYPGDFASDDLLTYVAHRSPRLRCVALISSSNVTEKGLNELIRRCRMLEELQITETPCSGLEFTEGVKARPELKRFRLVQQCFTHHSWDPDSLPSADWDAVMIASTMPQLRQLQLIGNPITNEGLHIILGKCHHLDTLDIRCCLSLDIESDEVLQAKLSKLKTVRLPREFISCYEYENVMGGQSNLYKQPFEYSVFDLYMYG